MNNILFEVWDCDVFGVKILFGYFEFDIRVVLFRCTFIGMFVEEVFEFMNMLFGLLMFEFEFFFVLLYFEVKGDVVEWVVEEKVCEKKIERKLSTLSRMISRMFSRKKKGLIEKKFFCEDVIIYGSLIVK